MPTEDLKVALLPVDIKLGNREWNLAMIESRIKALPEDVDLVMLPELCTTGFGYFENGVDSLAERADGHTIRTMQDLSHQYDMAICGGIITKDSDGLFNSCFFVAGGELKALYNKRHLFAGAESHLFKPGKSLPPVIEYKTWKLRPVICYDLRFPVWNRSVDNDYDAALLIANWPNSRFYAWKHLIIARAIENQVYVAACNREGEDVYGAYGRGDSMIVNAVGMPECTVCDDGTVMGTFNYEELNNSRKMLQTWRSADKFTISI